MKTKPLDEVLKAATPGEIEAMLEHERHSENTYHDLIGTPGRENNHFPDGPVADTMNRDYRISPDEDEANAALLAHYWNNFPNLVEALETMCDGSLHTIKNRDAAREALAQAKRVQMP